MGGVDAHKDGDLNDYLNLTVSYELTCEGDDASQGWDSQGDAVVDVGVNQTALMTVNATVPADAWNGPTMPVTVTAVAQDEEMGSFTFGIEVTHVPAWSASADQTYLDIHPNGSSIELTVIQQGNSPTMPYATVWVSGESGWDVAVPDELPVLPPG